MAILTSHIPSLLGGISQQPDELRKTGQCTWQENLLCNPLGLLQTRPGLCHLYRTYHPRPRGHLVPFDRSPAEPFDIYITHNWVYVNNAMTGESYTVSHKNAGYLSLPEGARAWQCYKTLAIGDTLFICNTTKTVKTTGRYPSTRPQALLWIRQATPGATITLTLDGTTHSHTFPQSAEITTISAIEALKKSLAKNTNYIIKTAADVLYITHKKGSPFDLAISDTAGGATYSLITDRASSPDELPPLAPDGYIVRIDGSKNTKSDDYYLRFHSDSTTSIASALTEWQEVKLSYSGAYLDPSAADALKEGDTLRWGKTPYSGGAPFRIALSQKIDKKTTTRQKCRHVSGARLKREYGAPWDGLTWDDLAYDECTEETVTTPAHAQITTVPSQDIIGHLKSGDKLYKKTTRTLTSGTTAVADGLGGWGRGAWSETAAPGITKGLDPLTMPHILVHDTKTDSWSFSPYDWTQRQVGDDTTNPLPSFVGRQIKDLFLYRNRIGFISSDSLAMTQAGDLANFFVKSAQTYTDADPIDLHVTGADTTPLDAAVLFGENLTLWSAGRQYLLTTPEVLSPKTCAVVPLTSHQSATKAGVGVAADRLFYLAPSPGGMDVYEYLVSGEDTKASNPITAHVPNLLQPKGDMHITVIPAAGVVVVATPEENKTPLYIYQYLISGGEKVLSAWSVTSFEGIRIDNIAARGKNLVVHYIQEGKDHIGTIDFAHYQPAEIGVRFIPALDHLKIYRAQSPAPPKDPTGYATSHGDTHRQKGPTLTFPYNVEQFPDFAAYDLKTGRDIPILERKGTSLTLAWGSPRAAFGVPVKTRYTLTKPHIQTADGAGRVEPARLGRFQLRRTRLHIHHSGPARAHVTYDPYPQSHSYTIGPVLGTREAIIGAPLQYTGTYDIPTRGEAHKTTITITSNHAIPLSLKSIEYIGDYVPRRRNIHTT